MSIHVLSRSVEHLTLTPFVTYWLLLAITKSHLYCLCFWIGWSWWEVVPFPAQAEWFLFLARQGSCCRIARFQRLNAQPKIQLGDLCKFAWSRAFLRRPWTHLVSQVEQGTVRYMLCVTDREVWWASSTKYDEAFSYHRGQLLYKSWGWNRQGNLELWGSHRCALLSCPVFPSTYQHPRGFYLDAQRLDWPIQAIQVALYRRTRPLTSVA